MRQLPDQIYKYPRTQHIEGSRLQAGDEDLSSIPFAELVGRHLVVEEKVDGANCAISFGADDELLLQSRGHYLTGGGREKHFNLLKQWATIHCQAFRQVLGQRYIMYGEWLYAKHTVFYNQLPHYFMEFDIFDRNEEVFLDTPTRHELIAGLSVVPVKVLHSGQLIEHDELTALVKPSHFIRDGHLSDLRELAESQKLDPERILRETDTSNLMEGLYVKVEYDGVVQQRYKWIRASFLAAVSNAEGHWLNRPIIPNQLADGVELFS